MGDIYITNAPTFVMKAKFMHNATFAVGYVSEISPLFAPNLRLF